MRAVLEALVRRMVRKLYPSQRDHSTTTQQMATSTCSGSPRNKREPSWYSVKMRNENMNVRHQWSRPDLANNHCTRRPPYSLAQSRRQQLVRSGRRMPSKYLILVVNLLHLLSGQPSIGIQQYNGLDMIFQYSYRVFNYPNPDTTCRNKSCPANQPIRLYTVRSHVQYL